MKIIYIESLQEKPISLYIKPDTAIHNKELPLYLPDFTAEVRANIVIMVKITKQGKCISEKFAHKYYEQFTMGLNLIAYDLQKMLRERGLPWEQSVVFDSSMVVGEFLPLSFLEKTYIFTQNGTVFDTGKLLQASEQLSSMLAYASQYFTFRTGDLLALPLTTMSYLLEKETSLEGKLQEKELFSVMIK